MLAVPCFGFVAGFLVGHGVGNPIDIVPVFVAIIAAFGLIALSNRIPASGLPA
jgi:hypothetical protein